MNKYIIKREIPNASEIPSEKLDEIGNGSESVLTEMRSEGKQIEQEVIWRAPRKQNQFAEPQFC